MNAGSCSSCEVDSCLGQFNESWSLGKGLLDTQAETGQSVWDILRKGLCAAIRMSTTVRGVHPLALHYSWDTISKLDVPRFLWDSNKTDCRTVKASEVPLQRKCLAFMCLAIEAYLRPRGHIPSACASLSTEDLSALRDVIDAYCRQVFGTADKPAIPLIREVFGVLTAVCPVGAIARVEGQGANKDEDGLLSDSSQCCDGRSTTRLPVNVVFVYEYEGAAKGVLATLEMTLLDDHESGSGVKGCLVPSWEMARRLRRQDFLECERTVRSVSGLAGSPYGVRWHLSFDKGVKVAPQIPLSGGSLGLGFVLGLKKLIAMADQIKAKEK